MKQLEFGATDAHEFSVSVNADALVPVICALPTFKVAPPVLVTSTIFRVPVLSGTLVPKFMLFVLKLISGTAPNPLRFKTVLLAGVLLMVN